MVATLEAAARFPTPSAPDLTHAVAAPRGTGNSSDPGAYDRVPDALQLRAD